MKRQNINTNNAELIDAYPDVFHPEKEIRLSTIINSISDPVILLNTDGRIGYMSSSSARFLGSECSKFVGRDLLKLIHRDDRLRVKSMLRENAANADSVMRIEARIKNSDDEWKYYELSSKCIVHNGCVCAHVITCRDISEHKNTQRDLLSKNSIYKRIADDISDTIWTADMDLTYTYVAAPVKRMRGYEPDEIVGTSILDGIAPGSRESVVQIYESEMSRLRKGDPKAFRSQTLEIELIKKNGSTLWCEVTVSYSRDENGFPNGIVGVTRNISDKRIQEQQLAHLAHSDFLTGLPNRLLFNDLLSRKLAQARRYHRTFAVMYMDLDGFKAVNDSLGHSIGDDLLKSVAERLNGCLRSCDVVARVGGDEFTVILDEVNTPADTRNAALRIIKELSKPFLIEDQDITITVSVGSAVFPEDGSDPDTLVDNSDTAMYCAKKTGKNIYRAYKPNVSQASLLSWSAAKELERAIRNNAFTVMWEPIIDIYSEEVVAAEATMKWIHPELGYLSPEQFLSNIRDVGLMRTLGAWFFNEICAHVRKWNIDEHADITAYADLRGFTPWQMDLTDLASQAIDAMSIPPNYLGIALTEHVLLQNPDMSHKLLRSLKTVGTKILVDDFGTGNSSISSVKVLPIDIIDAIKIHRSFIRNLATSSDDVAIVAAIVSMSHNLRLGVIAEGVDNAEQHRYLYSLTCDMAQGSAIAKPMETELFREYLIAQSKVQTDKKVA